MGREGQEQAAVLDVGCHSALLAVVRWRPGAGLDPVFSYKVRLRLHEALDRRGRVRATGITSVQRAVAEAMAAARVRCPPAVFPFATSVIRDAPNREEVIAQVARATGTRLRVLPGEEEARLAYVAARQWTGSETGPLLMLDIGGGTVEIASGRGVQPRSVLSLPLGARRITRDWLPGGTISSTGRLEEVREYLGHALSTVPSLPGATRDGRVVACSKTFEQLAQLAGAPPRRLKPHAGRQLTLPQLRRWIPVLAGADPARRTQLPGISRHRVGQSLAGALVAEALLSACEAESVDICPWSTREGLLLEHLGVVSAAPRHGLPLVG
ncbi:Ppx/GppA phosphatase family protein [Streptomyces sp. NPDC000880]